MAATTLRSVSERPRPRAVILDFAGVMTIHLSQAKRVPLDVDIDRAKLREVLGRIMGDHHPDSLWSRVERGEIALSAFIDEIERELPNSGAMFHPDSPHVVIRHLTVRPDMEERVHRWRQAGTLTALCTNNVAEWRPLWEGNFSRPLSDLFDLVVDSADVGMRKPEARIYEHVLAGLGGVAPHDAVFVDDLPANGEGARALGIHGLVSTLDDAHLGELDALFGSGPGRVR